jgi:NADPH2:quinone reductase
MKAIVVHETGAPDVLKYEDTPDPVPKPNQAVIGVEAAGVNFLDIYYREGFHWGGHHKRPLPYIPGAEGAGIVVSVGPETQGVQVGDRVAFGVSNGYGAYADYIAIDAAKLVRVPTEIDLVTAGAVMQQGLTAHYLTHSVFALQPNDTAVVLAAAGGCGLLITQMAKARGAKVIGIVSTQEKVAIVRAAGADEVLTLDNKAFSGQVRALTNGMGASVVYDSVGLATYEESLNSLAPRGMLVLFGQSSGSVPAFDTAILNAKGSLFLARPSLTNYVATRDELEMRAADIFSQIAAGKLDVRLDSLFALPDAPKAHERLSSRRSTGKIMLLPKMSVGQAKH